MKKQTRLTSGGQRERGRKNTVNRCVSLPEYLDAIIEDIRIRKGFDRSSFYEEAIRWALTREGIDPSNYSPSGVAKRVTLGVKGSLMRPHGDGLVSGIATAAREALASLKNTVAVVKCPSVGLLAA